MRRVFWSLCLAFCIFMIAVLSFAHWNREILLTSALSRVFGVPVSVGTFDYSHSHLRLTQLKINNPSGMKEAQALDAGELYVDFEPLSLFSRKINLGTIRLKNVTLDVEMRDVAGKHSNWSVLLETDEESSSSEEPATSSSSSSSDRSVFLKTLEIVDMRVKIAHPVLGKVENKVKNFTAHDLGGDSASGSRRMMQLLVDQMLKFILKMPRIQDALKDTINLPEKIIKNVFQVGKDPEKLEEKQPVLKELPSDTEVQPETSEESPVQSPSKDVEKLEKVFKKVDNFFDRVNKALDNE